MGKKLSQVDLLSSVSGSSSFLMESGDAMRRVKYANIKEDLMSALVTPPSTFTLEQNSNPAFSVSSEWAAQVYRSAMGGYMFKVVNGKVYAAKLLASDWNYFADGTKVDNPAKYETMVHVPKCYFKGDDKTLQFGGLSPVAGGQVFDSPEWIGAYKISYTGTADANYVAHSQPNVAPKYSQTMSQFFAAAQRLGSQFGLANYGFHCLINALFQASYGNLDSQTVIGSGFQHSDWEKCRDVPMGKCITLGDGSGKVLYNDTNLGNQYPVKLFGFEDLWAKLWEFRPGIRFYMDGETRYAVVYGGNRVSNTADGRKFTLPSTANGEYVTKMKLGAYWDMMPQAIGGSSTTYYCDGFWASTGGELLIVGGFASNGARCGLSYASSYDSFSYTGTHIGARLAFSASPVLVTGSELVAM